MRLGSLVYKEARLIGLRTSVIRTCAVAYGFKGCIDGISEDMSERKGLAALIFIK